MTLPDILGCRHSVGTALFLWEYVLCQTKLIDEPWMPVAKGIWISDEQLAYRLDVTTGTIKRCRKRLEQLRYLRTELALLEAPIAGFVN